VGVCVCARALACASIGKCVCVCVCVYSTPVQAPLQIIRSKNTGNKLVSAKQLPKWRFLRVKCSWIFYTNHMIKICCRLSPRGWKWKFQSPNDACDISESTPFKNKELEYNLAKPQRKSFKANETLAGWSSFMVLQRDTLLFLYNYTSPNTEVQKPL
jgi:hypothetical protein